MENQLDTEINPIASGDDENVLYPNLNYDGGWNGHSMIFGLMLIFSGGVLTTYRKYALAFVTISQVWIENRLPIYFLFLLYIITNVSTFLLMRHSRRTGVISYSIFILLMSILSIISRDDTMFVIIAYLYQNLIQISTIVLLYELRLHPVKWYYATWFIFMVDLYYLGSPVIASITEIPQVITMTSGIVVTLFGIGYTLKHLDTSKQILWKPMKFSSYIFLAILFVFRNLITLEKSLIWITYQSENQVLSSMLIIGATFGILYFIHNKWYWSLISAILILIYSLTGIYLPGSNEIDYIVLYVIFSVSTLLIALGNEWDILAWVFIPLIFNTLINNYFSDIYLNRIKRNISDLEFILPIKRMALFLSIILFLVAIIFSRIKKEALIVET